MQPERLVEFPKRHNRIGVVVLDSVYGMPDLVADLLKHVVEKLRFVLAEVFEVLRRRFVHDVQRIPGRNRRLVALRRDLRCGRQVLERALEIFAPGDVAKLKRSWLIHL